MTVGFQYVLLIEGHGSKTIVPDEKLSSLLFAHLVLSIIRDVGDVNYVV